jgi:hypothetical protein
MKENRMLFSEYMKEANAYYGILYDEFKNHIRSTKELSMTINEYVENTYGVTVVLDSNGGFCRFNVTDENKYTFLLLRHF